jgi:DivIVA domain-containing protein
VLAEWVEARKFSTTRLRPGYDQEEVDVFLAAIRDSFLGVRRPSLRPDEIRNKQFSTTRLRPGYEEEEVDVFLDEAELRLAAPGSDLDTGKAQDGEPELDADSPPVDADAIRAALRAPLMLLLDGARPSGTSGWVSAVAPVVTQAAVGAGHWAAGRRQRALAAWAGAAGSGLMAWGLGTEAPARAEVESIRRQQRDLLSKLGTKAPAAAGTQTLTARQRTRLPPRYDVAFSVGGMVIGVRSGLRHPRRLTVLAIASEAPAAVFGVLRVARAVQRRRPRTAAGAALAVAGSVARLRAASAEPLR